MDAGRFDALARALATGASRRRLLQAVPGLAVAGVIPWSVAARALDGGDEPVTEPVGGAAPCTGGADCATGEICLNGFCQIPDGGSAAAPAATEPAGGGLPAGASATAPAGEAAAPTPAPTAAADSPDGVGAGGRTGGASQETPAATDTDADAGVAEPTARAITSPDGQGGQTVDTTPTPTGTTPAVAEISPDQPLAAQIHEGVCGALEGEPLFPLIDLGGGGASDATPVADDGSVGAESAIPARLSTSILNVTIADLLENPHAVDIRLTADDPASSIACGDIGAPDAGAAQLAIGLVGQNGSGYAGIAYLQEQAERTVVTVFAAPGLGGAQTPGFAAPAPAAETPVPAAAPRFAAGAVVSLTEAADLHSAPKSDASVLSRLAEGASLTVTAAPVDGWVPVRDRETDLPGYVEAQYLKPDA